MNGEVQVIGQMGSSAILRGGETMFNIPSKFLHFVNMDTGSQVSRINATASQTATSGLEAMGSGIVNGFTGIIKDPIRMGKKKGVGGVFLGIGKGLVGFFTKPIAGILDGGVGAMAALRKLVNGEDKDVIPSMRIARAFPLRHIGVVDMMGGGEKVEGEARLVDAAQFAIQMNEDLWDEWIEVFFQDAMTKKWWGITTTLMFSLKADEGKISGLHVYKLRSITTIGIDGCRMNVTVKKDMGRNETLHIVALDYQAGCEIRDLVKARVQVLCIGEK